MAGFCGMVSSLHVGAMVGPQEETTDIPLGVCGCHYWTPQDLHNYWAGVFVLEAARFLYPAQHFALIDNDCVSSHAVRKVQDLL